MTTIFRPALCCLLAVCLYSGLSARAAYTVEQECAFAEALATEWRMPDYATRVLDDLEKRSPEAKKDLLPSRIMILAGTGKMTNAEEMVKSLPKGPDADAARIALAKAYYRMNYVAKAKEIFAEYFKTYTTPPKDATQLRAFRDACSQFGAMMKAAGDELAAVEAGRRYLLTAPPEEQADAIRCDMAVLLIQASQAGKGNRDAQLQEAAKLADTVLRHGVNVLFGQALVSKANVMLMNGDRKGAQKLIKDYMDVLLPIDESLAEEKRLGESPLAGVRMLNGKIFEDDAKAAAAKKEHKVALELYIKAITEYINVSTKYGMGDYGIQATGKAQEIKKILEGAPYFKKVKWTLSPEAEEEMLAQSFRLADQKMRERDFKVAIEEYLKVLQVYPESRRSVRALGSLLRCYAESGDELMVKATATYIGERFRKYDFAPDLIRGLGKFYVDSKNEAMFLFVCDTYLENFPKDQNAAKVLLSLASIRMQAEDPAGAMPYYERIVRDYTNDSAYASALAQLGGIQLVRSNYAAAAESFRLQYETLPPGIEKLQAQVRYADGLRLTGKLAEAMDIYTKAIAALKDKNSGFESSVETAHKAKDLLEKCLFFSGVALSRITEPADQLEANRKKAIEAFDIFLTQYPNSTNYAPKALAAKGQVYLAMDNFDEAFKVFDSLSAKYPNSPEGKNALISLVQSALEIKRVDQAKKAFGQMLSGAAKTTVNQMFQIGQLWLDNGGYPEAIQSFKQVVGKTQDKNIIQPAMYGLGRALYLTKDYEGAIKTLEDLVKQYERTPYYFDVKLTLSAAYREVKKFHEATEALTDLLSQPNATAAQKTQAQFEVGQLQEAQGDMVKALTSYQRVATIASFSRDRNPDVMAWVEKCIFAGLEAGKKAGKWADVIDLCGNYEKLFPRGERLADIRRAKSEAIGHAPSAAPAVPAAP